MDKYDIDYRLLFENMDGGFALHDMICDDAGKPVDYRYLQANPAFERLTGLKNVVGRTVREVLPGLEDYWVERFGRVALMGEPAEFEDYVADLDRWYNVRAFCPQRGRFAVVFHEITQRKRYEAELERFKFILENANEEFYLVRPDGDLTYVNRAAAASLGYTVEEMLRLGVPGFDTLHSRDGFRQHFEDLKRRVVPPFETIHKARDGRLIVKEMRSIHMKLGNEAFVCGFGHDITERKRVEEERLAMERQIQQTQKLESLGVLAGGIAHDFNNILMAVLGNVDLVREDIPSDSPAGENLADIERAARRAADLCRQLLAYSGKGRFVVERVDLNEIIADMTHMFEISISKKAAFRKRLAAGLPPIEADATQIRQVVMNLVINASEALGPEGGSVSVTTGVMDCDDAYLAAGWLKSPPPAGRYVYLEVGDSGSGIASEALPRIFDPFFTTKSTGRGLGLAAVLGIVRGHRGALKIYTEVGKGSTFKVLFPAVQGAPADARPAPTDEQVGRGGGTVLVVDDEEAARTVAAKMLKRLGYDVLTAVDGRDGLDRFAAARERIVCVLLDLTMPRMDGEETFRELRRMQPDVRVVLSSGYNEQDVTQRFVGKGLSGFLQKPYQLAELAAMVRAVLSAAPSS